MTTTTIPALAAVTKAAQACITTGDPFVSPRCACTNLPMHDNLCPEDPDPFVCDLCDEVFDPDEARRSEECSSDHCDDCRLDCHRCRG